MSVDYHSRTSSSTTPAHAPLPLCRSDRDPQTATSFVLVPLSLEIALTGVERCGATA